MTGVSGASFDSERIYRYSLWRDWRETKLGKTILFVMLNPSTADEAKSDPTITRCLGFAKSWGFSKLIVGNLFALRSSEPRELYKFSDPIGPKNDFFLKKMNREADKTVLAWGNHGEYRNRGRQVVSFLESQGKPLFIFQMTKLGQPLHPLYLRANHDLLNLEDWKRKY